MKTLTVAAMLLSAPLCIAATTINGLFDSNAGTLTEFLIRKAKTDSYIIVDTSVYTVTKVTRVDHESAIECLKTEFGATPAHYKCTVSRP